MNLLLLLLLLLLKTVIPSSSSPPDNYYDTKHVFWSKEGLHTNEMLVVYFHVHLFQPLLIEMSDEFPPRNVTSLSSEQLHGFTRLLCNDYTVIYDSIPNNVYPYIKTIATPSSWISVLRLPVNHSVWYSIDDHNDFNSCRLMFHNDYNGWNLLLPNTLKHDEISFEYRHQTTMPTLISSSLLRWKNPAYNHHHHHQQQQQQEEEKPISFVEVQSLVRNAFSSSSSAKNGIIFEDKTLTPIEQQNMHDVISLIQVNTHIRHMNRGRTNSRMIYELVIKPIINIIRRLATQALEKFLAMTMVNLLKNLISSLVTLFSTAYVTEDEPNLETAHHLPNPIEDFEPVLNNFGCEMEGGRRHSVEIGRPPGSELPDCNQVWNSRQDEPFAVDLTLLQIWQKQRHFGRDYERTKGRLKDKGTNADEMKHMNRDGQRFREVMEQHARINSEQQFLNRLMTTSSARNKAEAKEQERIKAQMKLRAHLRLMSVQAAKLRAYATANAGVGMLQRFEERMNAVVSNKHRLNFVTKPVLDMLEPRLFDELTESVTMECQMQLEKTLTIDLMNEIKEFVNTTCVRDVTRRLVTKLTEDLSHNVVQTTSEILTKDLTELVTKHVTKTIIPELTFALVIPIAKALTRAPVCDYYCHFCFHHKLYCADCQSCMLGDYYLDYYSHYYARYYGRYYAMYYGDYYSKLFSNDMRKPWFWGGQKEYPREVNQALDPENDAMPVGSHDNIQTPRQPHIDLAPGFTGQIRAL